jgi:2-polyprenyl-3-methyl-5-hydroxy-6-metoxy-1,4-benzoquinol methylase
MTGALDSNYKRRLEEISETHLAPDAGQIVDAMVRSHIRDRIMRWVEGPDVLEMGAGELMWTGEIVEKFGHSSIVDGSGNLLHHAQATYGDKVTCYESFFEDFTPADGRRFQTVIATHVLEHVYSPVDVLKRSHAWLAEGGRMILVVPNATSIHRRLGVKMGALKTVYDFSERDHRVGHQRVYDLETLKSDALAAGFRIVHVQGFFLKILPVAKMVDFPDALVKALFDVADEIPPEMTSDIGLVLASGEGA